MILVLFNVPVGTTALLGMLPCDFVLSPYFPSDLPFQLAQTSCCLWGSNFHYLCAFLQHICSSPSPLLVQEPNSTNSSCPLEESHMPSYGKILRDAESFLQNARCLHNILKEEILYYWCLCIIYFITEKNFFSGGQGTPLLFIDCPINETWFYSSFYSLNERNSEH